MLGQHVQRFWTLVRAQSRAGVGALQRLQGRGQAENSDPGLGCVVCLAPYLLWLMDLGSTLPMAGHHKVQWQSVRGVAWKQGGQKLSCDFHPQATLRNWSWLQLHEVLSPF